MKKILLSIFILTTLTASSQTRIPQPGIAPGVGTKAVRYDPIAKKLYYTDTTVSGGGSALSSITAATTNAAINSLNNDVEWSWNTLAGKTGFAIKSTSTAAAANSQILSQISLSGANSNSNQSTTAQSISNTHTGTGATNVALGVTASGGSTNYSIYSEVGINHFEGFVELLEQSAPSTPASTFGRLYPKTDGKLYWKDDAGTEYDLTAGAGGGWGTTGVVATLTGDAELAAGTHSFFISTTNHASGMLNIFDNGVWSIGDHGDLNSTGLEGDDAAKTITYNAENGHTFTGDIIHSTNTSYYNTTAVMLVMDSITKKFYHQTIPTGDGLGLLHAVAGNGLVQVNDSTTRLDTSWTAGALTLLMAKKKFDSTSAAIAAAYQPLDGDLTSWAAITRASGFDTWTATPSSANLRSLLSDENGTGIALFNGATTPDFTTGITVGGAAANGNILQGNGINYVPTANTGGWTALKVAGSNVTNNTTSLADITGLVSGTLATATLYEFEAVLYVNSSSTAGMQIAVDQTGTGSGQIGVWSGSATNAAATGIAIGSNALATAGPACVLVNGDGTITVRGFIKTGSSGSPTIKLRFLKTTSGTATVYIGSVMRYRAA